jgi:hypothetical protein
MSRREKIVDYILGSLATWAIFGALFLIADRIY